MTHKTVNTINKDKKTKPCKGDSTSLKGKTPTLSPYSFDQDTAVPRTATEQKKIATYEKILRYFDWNHLRSFYYVAKAKSFTAGAEYLNITQSGLSRVIQHFERNLGERLFIRGSRQVTLTRAGEIVLDIATQSFHRIESLVTQIQEDREAEQGDIRLWAGGGFLRHYLLPYLADFAKQYPRIQLRMTSSKVMPELELMEADVVVRPYFPNRPDLIQTPLLTNHVNLYASVSYLDAFGTPKTIEDLDRHRLIAYGHPPGLAGYDGMNWHLTAGRPVGQARPSFIEIDQPEDRLELAVSGLGITTISREHPRLKCYYSLVEVLSDVTKPTLPCCFIYSGHLQAVKRIQLLENYLVMCFARDYGMPTL